jgi:hypothetical protein
MAVRPKRTRANEEITARTNAEAENAVLTTMSSGLLLGALFPAKAEGSDQTPLTSRAAAVDSDVAPPTPNLVAAQTAPAIVRDSPDQPTQPVEFAQLPQPTPPSAAPVAPNSAERSPAGGQESGDGLTTAAPRSTMTGSSGIGITPPEVETASSQLQAYDAFVSSLAATTAARVGEFTSQLLQDVRGLSNELISAIDDVTAALFGSGFPRIVDPSTLIEPTLTTTQALTSEIQNTLGEFTNELTAEVSRTAEITENATAFSQALFSPGVITSTLGTPSEIAAARFAPQSVGDSGPYTLAMDLTIPVAVEVSQISLGFLGQSYAAAVDPHDLSFSPLGGGLHGLG